MAKGRGTRSAGLSLLLISAAWIIPLAPSSAWAQAVQVVGNSRVDAETIRSYFPAGRLDAAAVDEGVRALLATGQFSDVRASRTRSGIVVRVVESSVVNRVTFVGNSRVRSDQLFSEIQTRARGPYSEQLINADLQRLREIYRRVGRADAQISVSTAPAAGGRLDVTFTINEGSKTAINQIRFVGNNAYSAWRLKNVMQTTEANLLSFLKSSDVYDPDRIAADVEAIRRFYLRNGFIDMRVLGTDVVFDEARRGYIVTITLDEGEQYRVGAVDVESRIPEVNASAVRGALQVSPGGVYNAEAVEKSVERMTTEVARRGYAFGQVRPRGDRDVANRTVNLAFTVDEGPRLYIERINVRGNTRTRDYVVRREFDLGEGDAFNRALIDRAERRLRNLGYFKNVRITQEPGSTPDRVIVNVDVEDQATGQFSIGAGYSTNDGFLGDVAISESNFLGRGQFVRLGVSTGERSRGFDFSFTEPYFLDQRIAAGFDVFSRFTNNLDRGFFTSQVTGGTLRVGVPITDEISVGVRYSLFQTELKIPNTGRRPYNDCSAPIDGFTPGTPGAPALSRISNCLTNGEASLAVKESQGRLITSLVGATLIYNSLDDNRKPTQGWLAELRGDIAGLGGSARFGRVTGDIRYFHPLFDDVIATARVQGGHVMGFGGYRLRLSDHFNPGPSLVRGFAPSGFGPRDIALNSQNGSLGGTTYLGGSLEVQFPIFGLPREVGLRAAVFADAGILFNYAGSRTFNTTSGRARPGAPAFLNAGVPTAGCEPTFVAPTFTQGNCITVRDKNVVRSSVGASLLWDSPLGPIRIDYAFALSRDKGALEFDPAGNLVRRIPGDRVQAFRFSGGGRF